MYRRLFKRLLDVLLSIFMLVILSPLLMLVAVLIKVLDPGPVLFVQTRTGREGLTFRFFKFRSMPVGTSNVSSDQLIAVKFSAIGKLIRGTNIDELPQLVNILKADMSIVGPRPAIPSQEALTALRRTNGALACRPGLTGLAQVSSYDGMAVEEKARLDGLYASRITFIGDVTIIARTFKYLLSPPPVY